MSRILLSCAINSMSLYCFSYSGYLTPVPGTCKKISFPDGCILYIIIALHFFFFSFFLSIFIFFSYVVLVFSYAMGLLCVGLDAVGGMLYSDPTRIMGMLCFHILLPV